jgi:hypothetical protein
MRPDLGGPSVFRLSRLSWAKPLLSNPEPERTLFDRRASRLGGRESDLGQDILLLEHEPFMGCPLHGPANGPLIDELHFRLRWMHVDIDLTRIELDPDHPDRVASDHEQAVERLL